MDDDFAALGLKPKPWISAGMLDDISERIAREEHPDRGGDTQEFAHKQEALQRLKSPVHVLREFLAIHGCGGEKVYTLDHSQTEHFEKIIDLLTQVNALGDPPLSGIAIAMWKRRATELLREITRWTEILGPEKIRHEEAFEEWTVDEGLEVLQGAFPRYQLVSRWLGQLKEAQEKLAG
ncbi:MAG: hypothetical protein ACFCU3_11415 [Verrucomicrobiales bacterium]